MKPFKQFIEEITEALTAKQKTLPPALQKAILAKAKKDKGKDKKEE